MRAVVFRSVPSLPKTRYHDSLPRWYFILTRLKNYLLHEQKIRNSYALADIANIHLQRYEVIPGPRARVIELSPLHLWLAFAIVYQTTLTASL
jgi:hypothetical protein